MASKRKSERERVVLLVHHTPLQSLLQILVESVALRIVGRIAWILQRVGSAGLSGRCSRRSELVVIVLLRCATTLGKGSRIVVHLSTGSSWSMSHCHRTEILIVTERIRHRRFAGETVLAIRVAGRRRCCCRFVAIVERIEFGKITADVGRRRCGRQQLIHYRRCVVVVVGTLQAAAVRIRIGHLHFGELILEGVREDVIVEIGRKCITARFGRERAKRIGHRRCCCCCGRWYTKRIERAECVIQIVEGRRCAVVGFAVVVVVRLI